MSAENSQPDKALISHRSPDDRYNAGLKIARQLNAESERALKPANALSVQVKQLLPAVVPLAVGAAGVTLAGVAAVAKVMRALKNRSENAQPRALVPAPQEDKVNASAVVNPSPTEVLAVTVHVQVRTIVIQHQRGGIIRRRPPSDND